MHGGIEGVILSHRFPIFSVEERFLSALLLPTVGPAPEQQKIGFCPRSNAVVPGAFCCLFTCMFFDRSQFLARARFQDFPLDPPGGCAGKKNLLF